MKKSKLEAIQHEARQDGYDSGYQDGYAEAYELAYITVWDIARRLCVPTRDGGYTGRELCEMFGTCDVDWIITYMSAKDVARKLDEYDSQHRLEVRYTERLADDNRALLESTLEAFCQTQDVSMDAVIAEVLAYGKKAS